MVENDFSFSCQIEFHHLNKHNLMVIALNSFLYIEQFFLHVNNEKRISLEIDQILQCCTLLYLTEYENRIEKWKMDL